MPCGRDPKPAIDSNIAIARLRDAQICWLLDSHPVTAAMLIGPGWFLTKKKALKRLATLIKRRRIHLVGTVSRGIGRPEHVYCRWRPKPDQLVHEVLLSDLCFRLDAGRILRGPHGRNTEIWPDAEVCIRGQVYYLELDRGTMGYGQIARRFQKYEGCPHFVLWVCSSEERLEGMRRRAERIRATALFTTLEKARLSPHDAIWRDYGGGRVALPREGANSGK